MPAPDADPASRLAWFVNFLEHPDITVANDAYAEVANAPYEEIALLADKLSRESVQEWVLSPETPATFRKTAVTIFRNTR